MGLGIHNYLSQVNVFPAEELEGGTGPIPSYPGSNWLPFAVGWSAAILPEIEQQAMYNAINVHLFEVMYVLQNTTVSYNQLAALLCPSESLIQRPSGAYAATNYVNSRGGPAPIATWSGVVVPGPSWDIPNGSFANFGVQSVTDGTSNTAMISERLIGVYSNPTVLANSINAKRAIFQTGLALTANSSNPTMAVNFVAACRSLPGTSPSQTSDAAGYNWGSTLVNFAGVMSYFHFNTPNGLSCAAQNSSDPAPPFTAASRAGGLRRDDGEQQSPRRG